MAALLTPEATGVFLDCLQWVVPDFRDVESSVQNAICGCAGRPVSGCCDWRRCGRAAAFGLCLHAKGNVIMCECHGDSAYPSTDKGCHTSFPGLDVNEMD